MKHDSTQKGAIVLMLIAAVAIMSAFTAAMLSLSTTAVFSELNANNFNKAFFLAESGMRYALAFGATEERYYTIIQRDDGTFYKVVDNPPPATPAFIGEAGVHIAVDDCGIRSTGVVKENTMFEAIRTVVTEERTGVPCWRFDATFGDTDFLEDGCGANSSVQQGDVWRCGAGYAGALDFDGASHVDTTFKPYCEIGDNQSFSLSFWARPRSGAVGTVLGADDGNRQFAVGIDGGGRWFWAYGDQKTPELPAVYDRWQYVVFAYNADRSEIAMDVTVCGAAPGTAVTSYNGSGLLPESVKNIFIGALNDGGSATAFFNGMVDDIVVKDAAETIPTEKSPVFCIETAAIAHYPFDDAAFSTAEDVVGGYDGFVSGAQAVADRFGCLDTAYLFSGSDFIDKEQRFHDPDNLYPFTITAWVKLEPQVRPEYVVFSFNYILLSNGFSRVVQFGLYLGEVNGEPGHVCARGVRQLGDRCSVGTVDDGQWHFIAAVFTSQSDRRVYIDGNDATNPLSVTPGGAIIINPTENWAIGRWAVQPNAGFFSGVIDDVTVFNRSLTDQEIAALASERL